MNESVFLCPIKATKLESHIYETVFYLRIVWLRNPAQSRNNMKIHKYPLDFASLELAF